MATDDAEADETLAEVVASRGGTGGSAASACSAFERLYDRHAPLLLAFLKAHVNPAEAEDLHQVVWLRVWGKLPAARPAHFRGRLYQIAKNAAKDHRKKKRPDPLADDRAAAIVDDRSGSPEDVLVGRERASALARCLARLNEKARSVVRGHLAAKGYDEIARDLGIETKQAHRLFYKAKAALQECLEGEGEDGPERGDP